MLTNAYGSSLFRNFLLTIYLLAISVGSLNAYAGRVYINPRAGEVRQQTARLQKAIDSLASRGGGQITLGAGRHVTATITMRSNIHLELETGCLWLASNVPADYEGFTGLVDGGIPVPILIYARGQQYFTITGQGVIDGQASHDYGPMREVDDFIPQETELARRAGVPLMRYYTRRPHVRLVYLDSCRQIRLAGLELRASPNWTVHVQECDGVMIDGLSIFSSLEAGVNADGLDIDNSTNVCVTNCRIETGDDAICLKSSNLSPRQQRGCEKIVITNCVLKSTSTAIKLGTGSHGWFHDVIITNCALTATNRGIGFFIRDGGSVRDVIVRDITMHNVRANFNWWGSADPIYMVIDKRTPNSRVGSIERVRIQNVMAQGRGTSRIEGMPESPIRHLRIDQVRLGLGADTTPDSRMTHMLTLKHVENALIDDLELAPDSEWMRRSKHSLIHMERCRQVAFRHLLYTGPTLAQNVSLVTGAQNERCRLSLSGGQPQGARLIRNPTQKGVMVMLEP